MIALLSLAAAFFYGLDPFFTKKGLAENPYPIIAAIISLSVNVAFFLILSFLTSQFVLIKSEIFYFLIAGLLAPGMARIFYYKGIDKLGAGVSAPLIGIETLFAFILAVVLLEERITFLVIVGVCSICLGVLVVARGADSEQNFSNRLIGNKRYLAFPIIAAAFFGTSVFLRKLGLNNIPSPILGATITCTSSFVLLTLLFNRNITRRKLFSLNRRGVVFFLLSGGSTSLAWLSYFYALSIGKVVTVAPIINSNGVVTVFLSYLFLKKLEKINYKIVAGTFLVVVGVYLLTTSS